MRFIGYVVVIGILIGGALHFGGFWEGEVDVGVTAKGRQTFNKGVDSVQSGVNKGLDIIKVDEATPTTE